MSGFDLTRIIIAISILIVIFVIAIDRNFHFKKFINAKFIVRTGIFSAISVILYITPYLKFSVPFFPGFLELHFDEIPAFICGFAYGPLSAFFVILIKTLIKLPFSTSLCVGELADFIYSIIFIIPASIIYRRKKDIKHACMGLLIGTILQVILASLITSFVILNFYMFVMGLPKEAIINMCKVTNPNINSLGWSFFVFIGVPFNIFKDVIVCIITFILYKRLHRLIDKI